jgi:hypothetical protein
VPWSSDWTQAGTCTVIASRIRIGISFKTETESTTSPLLNIIEHQLSLPANESRHIFICAEESLEAITSCSIPEAMAPKLALSKLRLSPSAH